jgi:hypothetical protein
MQKGASDDIDDNKIGKEGGNQRGVAHKTFLFYSAERLKVRNSLRVFSLLSPV